MCEQCLTWPISFGEPLEGFTLMRARRDGNDWKRGEWALIECNDPTFTWRKTPTPSPTWGMTDEEEDAYEDTLDKNSPEYARLQIYSGALGDFSRAFEGASLMDGYRLVTAAMDKGYDRKKHGWIETWLFDYLGEWLKTAEMEDEGDAFPKREEFAPVDLTIGRHPIPGEDQE